MTAAASDRQIVRHSFTGVGLVLVVGMTVAIVFAVRNDATVLVPFAAVALALGLLYAWAGISGYIDEPSKSASEADSDQQLYIAGVILGILIPFVGFIIGVVLLIRGNNRYGLMAMIGSIGFSILYYQLFFTN